MKLISTCWNIFKTRLSAAIYHIIHGHVNKRNITKYHSKMSTTINNPISSSLLQVWEPSWYSVETKSPLSPKSPAVGISSNPYCSPEGDLRLFFQNNDPSWWFWGWRDTFADTEDNIALSPGWRYYVWHSTDPSVVMWSKVK